MEFAKVTGVISTPTMRYDGTILDSEGYDPATELLLLAPPPMPPIPEKPTKKHAEQSLRLLEDLLVEFPLVGEVDKAVALSAFITPVVRAAFPVAPMHAARAPTAGTGKSYLFDCVAAISIGDIMPVISIGGDTVELEKRLGAELLTGQPLISIDNISGELRGDALCQIIERPAVNIRILGKSERVKIETRSTTMFCTGNNIVIVGDLCRRVITVILDAQLERPELRNFKSNPVMKILENRGQYIAACLTICRAYIVAGRPNKARRLASFEGWSDTVRSALIWLGKADPVKSMEDARADDPELIELLAVISAWIEVFGVGKTNCFTLAEVMDEVNNTTHLGIGYEPTRPRLTAAIQAVASWRKEPANVSRLSMWMRAKKGRVVGGYRFANNISNGTWWVEAEEKGKPGQWSGEKSGLIRSTSGEEPSAEKQRKPRATKPKNGSGEDYHGSRPEPPSKGARPSGAIEKVNVSTAAICQGGRDRHNGHVFNTWLGETFQKREKSCKKFLALGSRNYVGYVGHVPLCSDVGRRAAALLVFSRYVSLCSGQTTWEQVWFRFILYDIISCCLW